MVAGGGFGLTLTPNKSNFYNLDTEKLTICCYVGKQITFFQQEKLPNNNCNLYTQLNFNTKLQLYS